MTTEDQKFIVSIHGEIVLTRTQIWPDGDGPEHPKASDVVACMDGTCTSHAELLRDWDLDDDVTVDVRAVGGSDTATW